MKSLHIATALLEIGAGLALLFFPSEFAVLVTGGVLDTPVALTVARVGGAGLISLGLVGWLGRDDSSSRATRAFVAAMLYYNFATVVVLAYADLRLHVHGVALWPAVFVHLGMGIWCLATLRDSGRE